MQDNKTLRDIDIKCVDYDNIDCYRKLLSLIIIIFTYLISIVKTYNSYYIHILENYM